MDPDLLLADLLAGRTPALARAISVVENGRPGFERLLAGAHPSLGRARRIGVTGPPGAGKSTLVERLVAAYRAEGLKVGVIAVDPTSPFTGGALLGDRIRMESIALDQGVYIRSMASRGSLGGLATTTREVCDLLDAAAGLNDAQIAAARARVNKRRRATPAAADELRAWGRERGFEVPDDGPVPAAVKAAWRRDRLLAELDGVLDRDERWQDTEPEAG